MHPYDMVFALPELEGLESGDDTQAQYARQLAAQLRQKTGNSEPT